MSVRRRRHFALVLPILAIAGLMATPGAAWASCVAPPPLEEALGDAETVFVGTVVDTAFENRWATVSIEEVWRGPEIPGARVVIQGGSADLNVWGSTSREFSAGQRYIFLPFRNEAGELLDGACGNTQLWEDSMAVFRPIDAKLGQLDMRNDAKAIDLGTVVAIGGFVALVVAVMLAVGLLDRARSD